jgi:hypothetical protein
LPFDAPCLPGPTQGVRQNHSGAEIRAVEDAERAGELLSLTLREDTRGEAVLVTHRRDVI